MNPALQPELIWQAPGGKQQINGYFLVYFFPFLLSFALYDTRLYFPSPQFSIRYPVFLCQK